MKTLDRFLLKSFLGPFFLALTLSLFVLLMQFLWKYIDDLVGKGLDTFVIFQLLFYAVLTIVPTALPIACLFSSAMVMGNFGERYELVAMKSCGISLYRVIRPISLFIILVCLFAFYFANNVIPYANLKQRTLIYSITQKKPALNIKEGEYYRDIEGYVIRVGDKKADGKQLEDIFIYDHTEKLGNVNVTYAKRGKMYSSENHNFLIFDLYDGYSFQESIKGDDYIKRPLLRVYFKEQYQRFDLSSLAFSKADEQLFKGSYVMMSFDQLSHESDSLAIKLNARKQDFLNVMRGRFVQYNRYYHKVQTDSVSFAFSLYTDFEKLDSTVQREIKNIALENARSLKEEVTINQQTIRIDESYLSKHYMEMHRKFTLSIACFVLFMIGAPFGSIVRKGGLGLPLVISVLTFVIYHVLNMICEKSVQEGVMYSYGMWIPTLVFVPVSLFLTLKATADSPLFDIEVWQRFLKRIFAGKKRN